VGLLTAPIAIVVDAISYLGSASFLFGLGRRLRPMPTSAGGSSAVARPAASLRSEMAEGLRYFISQPLLRASSGSIVILNFAGQISNAILLVFAVRELDLGAEAIGLAISIGSLGVLAGATTAAGVGRRFGVGPTLIVASAGSGIATTILVFANAGNAFWLLVASGLINGYGAMLITINGLSLRQAVTPDALQGRVNATGRWINWSVIPVGAVLGGLLAGIIGLRATVAVSAALLFLSVPWLLLSPLRTQRELPRLAEPGPPVGLGAAADEAVGIDGPVLHTPG
jgi:MFS family permease